MEFGSSAGEQEYAALVRAADEAAPLIDRYGNAERAIAVRDARTISQRLNGLRQITDLPDHERPGLRDAIYHVNAELKMISEGKAVPSSEKATAKRLHDGLHGAVEFAPMWVRVLSAVCLGLGTMVGYRRSDPADRHFLLHVSGAWLSYRRLRRQRLGRVQRCPFFCMHVVFPAFDGRPDRTRSAFSPAIGKYRSV